MNSTRLGIDEESAQTGGAFVQSVRVSNKVKLKAGLYYNREFFGDFVLPLAGIEWRMNNRMWMYGLLPNSMRMEYKISKELYTGIAFKSITNSFRYKDEPGYFKWQDNHAGIFTDWYLPGKFVLSAEAGHTLFRKLSNRSRDNFHSFKQDGVIFKVGIYYRIRLDG